MELQGHSSVYKNSVTVMINVTSCSTTLFLPTCELYLNSLNLHDVEFHEEHHQSSTLV